MTLRVIAGQYGGRVLRSVRGQGTRPLLAQVREALFDILGEKVAGTRVWDLFAGTGATGIEALSRGAEQVIFIEKSNRAISVLGANIELLGEDGKQRTSVVRGDAWNPQTVLENTEPTAPNLVFLDPPYSMVSEDPIKSVYRATQIAGCMAPGGTLCFHFMEGLLQEDDFDPSLHVDIRHWGTSGIAFLELASTTGDTTLPRPSTRPPSAPAAPQSGAGSG